MTRDGPMISEKNTLTGPLGYWFILTLAALTLISAPLVVTGEPLPAGTYYVAPDGDDNNPGTLEAPLQSLEAARGAVRGHKAAFGLGSEGIAVVLREGTWTRTENFKLSSIDGGAPGKPVTWKAYPGETARIVGSTSLDPAWFSPVTDADPMWSRLDPAARGNVLSVNLADHGITDYGTIKRRGFGQTHGVAGLELFVNDAPMQLARYPDAGTYPGNSIFIDTSPTSTTFTIAAGDAADRMTAWAAAPDPWVHGHLGAYWADQVIDTASIVAGTRTFKLAAAPYMKALKDGHPFYIFNLLEELTVPGEWYLERSTGILYYWPDGDINTQQIDVSMTEDAVVTTDAAKYLKFEGLSVGMGRANLVEVDGGTDVTLSSCKLFGAGNNGVNLTGTNHSLVRSEVVDAGLKAVHLNGGVRASLTPGNLLVENSEIHRFGRLSWAYQAGIKMKGVGNRAAHNHIYDGPHAAILFEGNDHLIEYNEIHDVVNYSSDMGAIYAGRRWDWRGNLILYNYIHHIDSPLPGSGEHGVYLDDVLSGVSVFGNLFVEVSGNAINHGGGRDNLFQNNIMVRCGRALSSDSRGFWVITDPARKGVDFLAMMHYESVEYLEEPWLSAYPEHAAIPDSWATIAATGSLWKYPEGSVFSRNLGWKNDYFMVEDDSGGTGTFNKFAQITDNLENTDPRFVNAVAGDYRLAADSPALSIPGFVDIPFQQMGIQRIHSGLTGAWYNPDTNGQGFLINIFADSGIVFLGWFTFDVERPGADITAELGDSGHRWLTAQGPIAWQNENYVDLEIYRTSGGLFDLSTPKPSSEPDGWMRVEFFDCKTALISYGLPASAEFGEIPIVRISNENVPTCEEKNRIASPASKQVVSKQDDIALSDGFEINPGLNDAWFNPTTDGQGFFVTVYPDSEVLLLSWFTYDVSRPDGYVPHHIGEPGHRWMTAQGTYSGNSADLDVTMTVGGVFNSGYPIPEWSNDGTIKVEFDGCNSGLVTYQIDSISQSEQVPIQRIVSDNISFCESFFTNSD